MDRKTFVCEGGIALAEYIPEIDDYSHYCCWQVYCAGNNKAL